MSLVKLDHDPPEQVFLAMAFAPSQGKYNTFTGGFKSTNHDYQGTSTWTNAFNADSAVSDGYAITSESHPITAVLIQTRQPSVATNAEQMSPHKHAKTNTRGQFPSPSSRGRSGIGPRVELHGPAVVDGARFTVYVGRKQHWHPPSSFLLKFIILSLTLHL